MTTTRELVEFVAERKSGMVTFAEVRQRFNGDLTGLNVALERRLLLLVGNAYAVTVEGSEYLRRCREPAIAEYKTCPECGRSLPAAAFWKATNSGDGLFQHCIECANERKRKHMDEKRRQAIEELMVASTALEQAAALWDDSVRGMAKAWRSILEADAVIRARARDLRTSNESGRMHAHLTFVRAAYVMNLCLSEARWPQTGPFLREVKLPERLADYIGREPWRDYIQPENVADEQSDRETQRAEAGADQAGPEGPVLEGTAAPTGGGAGAGPAEPGDQGNPGDGIRGTEQRGRSEVSGAAGEKAQQRAVPRAGRKVPAKGHRHQGPAD